MTALARRINLVTLGVLDLATSIGFYERLGWRRSQEASQEGIAFLDLNGIILALFSRRALAQDAGVEDTPPGFSGVTLAINLASEAEVDAAFAEAKAAGAAITKPPQKVFWGGYSGYFSDPDGHLWEIAHNPFFPLDNAGRIVLPA